MPKTRRTKKSRDPTKPKRPQTAYMCFANAKRAEFRAKFPEESLMQVSKRIASAWHDLADKSDYEAQARTFKEAYVKAMDEWRAKQPPKIKKPRSAFALFVQQVRPALAAKFPDKKPTDLMREAGAAWRAADAATKEKFTGLALRDKERYARESVV